MITLTKEEREKFAQWLDAKSHEYGMIAATVHQDRSAPDALVYVVTAFVTAVVCKRLVMRLKDDDDVMTEP